MQQQGVGPLQVHGIPGTPVGDLFPPGNAVFGDGNRSSIRPIRAGELRSHSAFLVAKYKGKIRQKNPPENPPAGIEKSAGGEPPPETPSQTPPPPPHNPPPLGRATPSPEPSGLGLAAPVCLCRWLVRNTSACGGSHLVAQPVSGGLHSFLGAGAQRGANAALAGTGHGFSEMHALSIFGVKVWALNIEKKSAVRLCKTWQDNKNTLHLARNSSQKH